MNSPYQPKPGTIPAMFIAHLKEHGGTMTRADVANGFSIESKNVDGNLSTAIKHGLVVRHQVEGQKTTYGLPGSDPGVRAPVPPSSMTIQTGRGKVALTPKKAPTPKQRAAAPAIALEPTPVADAAPGPCAALWEDGDVVLYGMQINSDDTVTLTGAQAQRVHRFMERVYGPNE